jgi:hypothetical protein
LKHSTRYGGAKAKNITAGSPTILARMSHKSVIPLCGIRWCMKIYVCPG